MGVSLSRDGRQMGHFRLPLHLFEQRPDAVVDFFTGAIVIRCELHYDSLEFDYVAVHPRFDSIPREVATPTYEVSLDGTGAWTVRRVQP